MLKCIVYCSVASSPWTAAALDDLVRQARAKNAAVQVASRLVLAGGHFVHILEGPTEATDALYRRIQDDARHHSVVLVLEQRAMGRAFPEIADFAVGPPDAAGPGQALGWVDRSPQAGGLDDTSLLDLMASPSAQALKDSLRIMPRQSRAIDTVDRLLLAVERLAIRSGLKKFTVRDVADEASVTAQTAYRYFKHTDDLLRVLVSRRQTMMLERIRDSLLHGQFASEAELADCLISFLFGALQKKRVVTEAFWTFALRRYHDLQYDEIWSLAEVIFAALRRCRIPCAHMTEMEIAAGLTAVVAAAKGIAMRDPAFLRSPACRALMIRMFRSALGATHLGGGRPSPV